MEHIPFQLINCIYIFYISHGWNREQNEKCKLLFPNYTLPVPPKSGKKEPVVSLTSNQT